MRIATLANWLDDCCNPILVKELRQFLHNRAMLTVMGGLLAVQLGGIYFSLTRELTESVSLGRLFFQGDMLIFASCSGVLSFLGALRFFRERRGRGQGQDLVFTTPLSPFRLAWGKFLSAVVMELQIYALCLPFMMISYYLRGIGLMEILLISSLIFIYALLLIALGLCLGATGFRMGILVLPGFIALYLFWTCLLLDGRFFGPIFGILFWIRGAVFALWSCGFLLTVLQSMLGCSAGNRIFVMRIYLLLSAFLVAPLFYELTERVSRLSFAGGMLSLPSWETYGLYATGAIVLIAAVEPLLPSRRILIAAPGNRLLRGIYLLFSSSSVNGLTLGWICGLICVLAPFASSEEYSSQLPYAVAGTAGYLMGYAGIAIFLRRKLQRRWPRISGFSVLLTVFLVLYAIPMVYLTLYEDYIYCSMVWTPPWASWFSPLALHYQNARPGCIGALSCALIGVILNWPLLYRGWRRNFRDS